MRKKAILLIVVSLLLIGCSRNVTTVEFEPMEIVTEEVTTESVTMDEMKITYINEYGEEVELEPWTYLKDGEIPVGEYKEAIITLPENVYLNSYCIAGYNIFYSTEGDENKILRYNCISGETTELVR